MYGNRVASLDASTGDILDFDTAGLNRWIEGPPLTVTRQLVDAYAAAIDADPDDDAAPLFSVIACYPILFAAVDAVTPEPVRNRMVHGEHDVTVHRPVRPGDVLTAHGRPLAVAKTPAGARIHVALEVRDVDDGPVATHLLTAVARGVHPAEEFGVVPAGWPAAGARRPELTGAVPVPVAGDQSLRYAEATGDRNAVHIDDAAARAAGFPGVIAHGLGALGLVTSALVRTACAGDAGRLRRLRARISAPVFPGSTLTMHYGPDGGSDSTVAFDATGPDGRPALRDGWLELDGR